MEIDKFKIEEWMNEYEASAKIDLCATTVNSLSLKELLNICNQKDFSEIENIKLSYGNILGSEKLLKNISKLYKFQNNENIAVTHGAIGANQLVFLTLLKAGDEVISVVPNYQQHSSIPKSLGANVKEIFLKEENNWIIDIEDIKQNITNKTKLITFSNPNNPTGAVIPDEILKELAVLAEEYGIWILADEVYRGLNLFDNNYSKSICDIYEKGISTGSMSKTYSLAGLRLGWICTNKNFIKKVNIQRQYNTISISLIDDYLASLALENRQKIEQKNIKTLLDNYNILKNIIENNKKIISCILPTGGTTSMIRYYKNIPSTILCKDFQDKTKIALLPGSTMDMEGYVRIGLGIHKKEFETALKIFVNYLQNTK